MNTVGTPLLWGGFAVVVVIMLAIDLFLQGRRGAHGMTMKTGRGLVNSLVTLPLFNAVSGGTGTNRRPCRCRSAGAGFPHRLSD